MMVVMYLSKSTVAVKTVCIIHKSILIFSQKKLAETPFIMAIVTPLMARAHKLVRQAGELVFCDATASLDRLNTPVYIISTATAAGAIPLAVVMASGEETATTTEIKINTENTYVLSLTLCFCLTAYHHSDTVLACDFS